ncbi:hypothetical protein EIKCOROL_01068 [Eikenella corrodens ATCC 23834]|uniref:Uncharacterized protein n=1 Tax=Eikenella corrodens ATCC 23834 TaxID=546274 RepID=C0DUN2_EIKCO|nr:hypothetical protein EIKCOROL_01068 [Eikenella corrodens ATCC 23834]
MDRVAVACPRGDGLAELFVDEGAGDKHAFVYIKFEVALPGLTGEVGHGEAFVDAAFGQAEHGVDFFGQERGIEIGLEGVEREDEGVEDEIGGFIVGVIAAVAETEAGLVEAAGAKAQEVARGAEVLAGLGKHGVGVFMKW